MHQARHRTGGSARRVRPRSAFTALFVAAAGLAAIIWLPGAGAVASAAEQRPAFADDFDQARGTGLDLSKWNLDGNPAPGGDTADGVTDGDGHVVVTRMLRTRQAFDEAYGHAEARIEVARAAGAWRAFGVLDRYGRLIPGRLQTLQGGFDPTGGDGFHLYTLDWSPTAIVWSVDGKPTLRLIPNAPADGIVLVLNLNTDGRRAARMVIDFVHVAVYGSDPSVPVSPSDEPSVVPSSESPSSEPPSSESPSSEPPSSEPSDAPTVVPSASATPSAEPSSTVAEWAPFTTYAAGDLVTYEGATYKVLEAHTSLPGWEPPNIPGLFQKL